MHLTTFYNLRMHKTTISNISAHLTTVKYQYLSVWKLFTQSKIIDERERDVPREDRERPNRSNPNTELVRSVVREVSNHRTRYLFPAIDLNQWIASTFARKYCTEFYLIKRNTYQSIEGPIAHRLNNFGSHPTRRPDTHIRRRYSTVSNAACMQGGPERHCSIKIAQLHGRCYISIACLVQIDQDVLAFYIAVDDMLLMELCQCTGYIPGNRKCQIDGNVLITCLR